MTRQAKRAAHDRSARVMALAVEEIIAQAMLSDRFRLTRRLARLRRAARGGEPIDHALAKLQAQAAESLARRARRQACLPVPSYPEELPITAQRAAIREALVHHQVVIVAGETGSGKTTQLPKICLEIGRGVAGVIGCTQPRRIAATSVAARVASELGSELGQVVGYKIRFGGRASPDTYIKFMTDGILLAETQGDRGLYAYDTLIIDEAHERSLNIDFLLGYLKQLLPRRPELKVIISSATLDTERFVQFFDDPPVVQVAGRGYPVEVRYCQPSDDDPDLSESVADAVEEVLGAGRRGDVLVFLSGEREIREAAQALAKRKLPDTLVLPLYARLSAAEQARVFQPSREVHVVLATNVAETSITIPGVHYVVDTGVARINRYSHRTQVSRLRVEPISRASADQRKGRCGRLGPGLCIRLYGEEDYQARARFTDPEIKRTSLAAVILSMKALQLGEVESFPFLDPPAPRMVHEGYQVLHELGALDEQRELTDTGAQLARLPVDPRLGRIILASAHENALQEVLVIAAALSIQDPRERPLAAREAADQKHRRFFDEQSDFVGWLKLWSFYLEALAQRPGKNALRRWCRENFLSFSRMIEWRDIHQQLADLTREMGLKSGPAPATYEQLHRAVLGGLLSRLGLLAERDKRVYLGARQTHFSIFPGSGLAGRSPRWVVAAEIVETTRVYARCVARVEPEWVEPLASHLVRRSYLDPHWEKRAARVVAFEQVTLFGLPIVTRRRVDYGSIDPAAAREIFIRCALVGGDYTSGAPFFRHNLELIAAIEALEHKSRRRDVLVDEQDLLDFYDQRIPPGICDGKRFEAWWAEAERACPQLLFMDREALMRHRGEAITATRFPDFLVVNEMRLPLHYRFEPGEPDDGVTVEIPLKALPQLEEWPFEWLVPGLLEEKLTFLLKALPKALRVNFVPVPDYVRACLESLSEKEAPRGPLTQALSRFLVRVTGVEVAQSAWKTDRITEHLRMNFRVCDDRGRVVAQGRDLAALRAQLASQAGASFETLPRGRWERDNITDWDFGSLPERVELGEAGVVVYGFPALSAQGDEVALRVFPSLVQAQASHRLGLRRLFARCVPGPLKALEKSLPMTRETGLAYVKFGGQQALKRDILSASLDRVFVPEDGWIRDQDTFRRRLDEGRGRLFESGMELGRLVSEVVRLYHAVVVALGRAGPAPQASREDIAEQLSHLVYPAFVVETPPEAQRHYPRYLRAVLARLEKLADNAVRDQERLATLMPWWRAYLARAAEHRARGLVDPQLVTFRWMLEEWRVSLFAQELRTAYPVSAKRMEKQWSQVQP